MSSVFQGIITLTPSNPSSAITTLGAFGIGVVAYGSSQSNATLLTSQTNTVTIVPPGSGVILPALVYTKIVVFNRGLNSLLVYPPIGAQFENYGFNQPICITVNDAAEFTFVSSTQIIAR